MDRRPRLVMRVSSTAGEFRPEGAGPWTIGRSVACAWVLADPSVSRLHARLERAAGGWRVHDEESANGIRVDGIRSASVDLVDGMRLSFGDVVVDCSLTDVADIAAEDASAVARLDEVARLMRRLTAFGDEDAFLADVVDAAVRLVSAERGFVIAMTKAGMEVRAARNLAEDDRRGPEFDVSWSIAVRAGLRGEALLLVDAGADGAFSSSASVEALKLRSVVAVPIRVPGSVLGVLYLDHRGGAGRFSSDDLVVLEVLAHQAGVVIDRGRRGRTAAGDSASNGAERDAPPVLVGTSRAIETVRERIAKIAASDHPVLVTGESGVGKDVVARLIRAGGPRASGPWVPVNVATLPESLIESELFGHVRGAFTGADRARTGLIEAASGGTLFLDEVEAMSPALQARLLRALESGEIRPVGASKSRKVDVRVIAATNVDLSRLVADGAFREDLWYRLRVLTLDVPPLRDRRDDVPELVRHFLVKWGKPLLRVDDAALALLREAPWRGNVRELENEIRRLAATVEGRIAPSDLSDAVRDRPEAEEGAIDLVGLVAGIEIREIRRAMAEARGNKSRAADRLGITRFALQRKMEKYGLVEAGESDA